MKLKVLGVCAIASLLYGENIFAKYISGNAEFKDVNVKGLIGDFEKLGKANNAVIQSKNNDQLIKSSSPAEEAPEHAHLIHWSSSDLSSRNNQLIKSSNSSEANEQEFPSNDSVQGNSYSDSNASAEPSLYSDFKKMTDNFEKSFSEFKKDLEDFKLTGDSFLNNVLDNPNLSVEQLKNSANFFGKAKENIINKVDNLNSSLNQLSEIWKNLKMDEKIREVKTYKAEIQKLLDAINEKRKAQKRQKKQERRASKQIIGEIDWIAIEKYYAEGLSKFVEKARNFKFKFGDVKFYGEKCFEGQDGSMFNPQQEMDPKLRPLCAQIFKNHFPAARNAYLEIKKMTEEAKTEEVLEDFRSKILALGGSISSLIKQKSEIKAKDLHNERMEEVRNQTSDVSVSAQVERRERMRDVRDETQDVDVASQVERYERMIDTRAQTRNVNVKELAKELENQGQSKTDQLFRQGLNHPLNSMD